MRLAVLVAGLSISLTLLLFGEQQEPFVLSYDVDLVVLNARVTGRNGQSIPNLSEEMFRIEEDGRRQEITLFAAEDSPATIGLVLDASRSINARRRDIEAAAIRFVEAGHPMDELFVLRFDDELYWPLNVPFTDDVNLLKEALRWDRMGGRTALYDAIGAAIEHISKGKWDKRALVVLSDGGDTASIRKLEGILSLAQQSNVTIYTIGMFDPFAADRNPDVLRKLAELTGGDVYLPESIEELAPAWDGILHGIRAQYTIGYRPSQTAFDGRYHKIRVRVDVPNQRGVKVYARPGYLARKASER
jgi:Ca-activated chloride channel family protein